MENALELIKCYVDLINSNGVRPFNFGSSDGSRICQWGGGDLEFRSSLDLIKVQTTVQQIIALSHSWLDIVPSLLRFIIFLQFHGYYSLHNISLDPRL